MGISLVHPAMICCLSKICTRHIHHPSSLTQILQPSHTPRSSHHHHPTIVRKSLTHISLTPRPSHHHISLTSRSSHHCKSLTQTIPPSHQPHSQIIPPS